MNHLALDQATDPSSAFSRSPMFESSKEWLRRRRLVAGIRAAVALLSSIALSACASADNATGDGVGAQASGGKAGAGGGSTSSGGSAGAAGAPSTDAGDAGAHPGDAG